MKNDFRGSSLKKSLKTVENVSHNTSYSEGNVNNEDEEFVDDDEDGYGRVMPPSNNDIPNISQSEIEEMNLTGFAQMSMRIVYISSVFKALDLLSFHQNRKLLLENAFIKLKRNLDQK